MLTSVSLGMVLALEKAEEGIMTRPPRQAGKHIVGKLVLWRCLFVGTLLIVAVLGNMHWELVRQGWDGGLDSGTPDGDIVAKGQSVAMTTLTLGQVRHRGCWGVGCGVWGVGCRV
jgi:magnesium-transporting ATPase (P-type)